MVGSADLFAAGIGNPQQSIVEGLIARGMPRTAAIGFAGNFAVESGFNPGINEISPLVPGSRGGFGLAQWTGPRRREYEAFASQNGQPIDGLLPQLDFLMQELNTTEARSRDSIYNAQTPEEAARLVSDLFLRPGIPHLDRRIAAAQAIANGEQIPTGGPMQTYARAPARPPAGQRPFEPGVLDRATGRATTPPADSLWSRLTGRDLPEAFQGQPDVFSNPDVWQSLAMGLQGMTVNPNEAFMAAMQQGISGRREDRVQSEAMQREEQQRQQAAAQEAQTRQQAAAWLESIGANPDMTAAVANGYMTIEEAAAQITDPAAVNTNERYQAVGGRFYDMQPEGGGPPVPIDNGSGLGPGGVNLTFDPATGRLEYNSNGGVGGGDFTEGESKDVVYVTRAQGALEVLDAAIDEAGTLRSSLLTDRGDRLAGMLPMGTGGGLQNPEFQVAQQAGEEFLQAILRKDTGAAITSEEQALYGATYLPQPGDQPAVLEAKRQARIRAIEAIRGGQPPEAMIAAELALRRSEDRAAATGSGTVGNGVTTTTLPPPSGGGEVIDLGNGVTIRQIQ